MTVNTELQTQNTTKATSSYYGSAYDIQTMMQAGVHFGHQARKWCPKMLEFIYGKRNGIHIIDLRKTVEYLETAMNTLREIAAKNGRILVVCSESSMAEMIEQTVSECGQYYVTNRWFGGTLTNWGTIQISIRKLKEYQARLADTKAELTKNERKKLEREVIKLLRSLKGIMNMGALPDIIFVIGARKSHLAIKEAHKLGIKVMAILDTNCDPTLVDSPIPGNDDAKSSVGFFLSMFKRAVLDGLQATLSKSGMDASSISAFAEKKKLRSPLTNPAANNGNKGNGKSAFQAREKSE